MDPFKGTLKVLKGPGPGTESLPGDALRRKAPDLPTAPGMGSVFLRGYRAVDGLGWFRGLGLL